MQVDGAVEADQRSAVGVRGHVRYLPRSDGRPPGRWRPRCTPAGRGSLPRGRGHFAARSPPGPRRLGEAGEGRRAGLAGDDAGRGEVAHGLARALVGDRHHGIQARSQQRPGHQRRRAAVEPGHDRVVGAGNGDDRPARSEHSTQAAASGSTPSRQGGRGAPAGASATGGGREPTHADRDDDHVRRLLTAGGELGVDLPEDGAVALNDPGEDLLVAGPADVLDRQAAVSSGGGGTGDRDRSRRRPR